MKTNVVLSSPDRQLLGVVIRQDTEGLLSLSDLQEAYSFARVQHGWSDKRVNDILSSKNNMERIYYILEKQGVTNAGISAFIEECERQGVAKTLKAYKTYKTKGARKTKTVYANPYIWMLVALEMNPMIYAEVVCWLTDNLILNRIEAGNMYKGLTEQVSRFQDVDYRKLAMALNHIVFGKHETAVRNTGTQSQLKELETLERNVAFAVKMGYLKTFKEVLDSLRLIWSEKYGLSSKADV